jgi:hypothetical protein
MIPKCKFNNNMRKIWSGNLYVLNSYQPFNEPLKKINYIYLW